MKNCSKNTFFNYIKWVIALAAGIYVDYVCARFYPETPIKIILIGAVTVLIIFCFDIYKLNEPKNIIKLLFVAISTVTEGYFGIECVFLIIFEIIIKKKEKEDSKDD